MSMSACREAIQSRIPDVYLRFFRGGARDHCK
jgi:hypothetical protein